MKQAIIVTLFLALAAASQAQAIISGKVTNSRNEALPSASIRLKQTGTGVNADSSGNYQLTATTKGKQVIEVSSVGYATKQLTVMVGDTAIQLNIVLKDEAKQLSDIVVISAGTFEASDKAKGASLTPIDAVTVAGNGGDIAMALRSLPGAQQVGESEGLFVRGGTGEETKQFVDGTLLKNPNYPSVPGMPQPARLNPFLFKGILFNTGGYSALYGQALSSALILESVDLPEESSASLHIFPTSVGAGFQKLTTGKQSSYGANVNYGSYQLYNKVVKQKPDFFHAPEYLSGDANFRIKTSETGIVKFYTNYGLNHTGVRFPDIDSSNLFSAFQTKGSNLYANLSYRESLKNNWKIDAGLAYNFNKQDISNQLLDEKHRQLFLADLPYNEKNNETDLRSNFAQARLVVTKPLSRRQAFRFGAEHFYINDKYRYNDTAAILKDNLTAGFAEADIYITKNTAIKTGIRAEYSSLLNKVNLAPRISFAYRFNDGGQVNMAYGIFYQKPELIYLVQDKNLSYAQAAHYIVNYQKKAKNRLLRIEAYYKKYKDLVTTDPAIENNGKGYAKGIELFFRDKKTFKDFDYWITYTYLDTKRKWLNYPVLLQPAFATPHTASVAIKRFFSDLSLNVNLSYALATGRPYYFIHKDAGGKPRIGDSGTANMYNQMNLSFAYLFTMFKKWKHKDFSGIGMGINNVFGSKQIFGYNYSHNGLNRVPVSQPATRSFYIGLFMSFGIDRRDDFINENL